jgi:hypothetical protein
VRPAVLKCGVPEWKVLQPPNLPCPVLLDVFIFIDAAFPPLDVSSGMDVDDALMGARLHETAKAALGMDSVFVDVHNTLELRVVQKEAVYRPITAGYEGFRKAANVEPFDAVLAMESATKEFDAGVGIFGVEVSNLQTVRKSSQVPVG